jgi:hypothetical protein
VDGACRIGDAIVEPTATITLPWSLRPSTASTYSTFSEVRFTIDDVRSTGEPPVFPQIRRASATLRVRFSASPEVLNVMKAGDVDVNERALADADRAVLTDVGSERRSVTAETDSTSSPIEQRMLTFIGTVRVPVVMTPSGWSYKDRRVRIGSTFEFETVDAAMTGVIVDLKVAQDTAGRPE